MSNSRLPIGAYWLTEGYFGREGMPL